MVINYKAPQKKEDKKPNAQINTFLKTKGKISGGTWASFLNSFTTKKPIFISS